MKTPALRLAYFAYRPWAQSIAPSLQNHPRTGSFEIITSKQEFDSKMQALLETTDIAIFVGWSWIIPAVFYEKVLCIGMHPSDLPSYKGGSPIQYQILDGLAESMATLFTITKELDAGDIWLKQPYSLEGDTMDEILANIGEATRQALILLLDRYPDIAPQAQPANTEKTLRRRTPEKSALRSQDFQDLTAKQLYDFIRALTDPYPNAYLQDANGDSVVFTGVKFKKGDVAKPPGQEPPR